MYGASGGRCALMSRWSTSGCPTSTAMLWWAPRSESPDARRWKTQTEHGATMILELPADDPERGGGRVQALAG